MHKQIIRYIQTIRYLKLKQIVYRLYYKLRPLPKLSQEIQAVRPWKMPWRSPLRHYNCLNSEQFTLFNETGNILDGTLWQSSRHTKLWLYHLHYFDALNSVESESHPEWMERYIEQWLLHHQTPFKGIYSFYLKILYFRLFFSQLRNLKKLTIELAISCFLKLHSHKSYVAKKPRSSDRMDIAWDPYPLSLRIVNWIKWFSRRHCTSLHLELPRNVHEITPATSISS